MAEESGYREIKTRYPGVTYILGTHPSTGKPDRIFYISYYRGGKRVHEKAGRASIDGMTASKANGIRTLRMEGKDPSNTERRKAEEAARKAQEGRWTIDRLWTEWKKANVNKPSRVNDDNRYKNHLKVPFGDKEPRELVPLDVDRLRVRLLKAAAPPPGRKFNPDATRRKDYSEEKKKELVSRAVKGERKPYAIGTVKSILGLLTKIANFGLKRQLCPGLSFKIEGPKGAKIRTEDMTEEQMTRYIRTCREWEDAQAGNFQLLALYTGMRRSEVRKLKWADVDFDRGFLLLRDPKGGEDVKIPCNGAVAELLRAQPKDGVNPYVFPGERGKGPRGLRQIGESSRAIRNAAGLPKDFRPNHGLRHTFASHLASSGEVDLYTLQRLMTHKSPTMTQRYAHLSDAALKRGADVMGRIVEQATPEPAKDGTNE